MTDREKRLAWFTEARFGMFIHWGIYAIPAHGEWYRSHAQVPVEAYQKYFDRFDPKACDIHQWARLAHDAGMRYMVLTAKHHDGFCLFDSKLTDYKSTNTPAGRDFIAEYVEACRDEGLKVGLYYSLLDWHHPDYPKYADKFHPMRGNEAFKDEKINFDRYLDYMHGQIEELVSNYGKIDVLWFDFSYENLSGKAWRAEELVSMVRKHQPDVILDNRLEASGEEYGGLLGPSPAPAAGDFVSPEQSLPQGCILNYEGKPVTWELCTTINNSWSYMLHDRSFKTASFLIHKLVECVSKGGNLLLDVGPDANGRIPLESVYALYQVGEWMQRNGESIYGCGPALDLPRPDWGRYTRKGNIVYGHLFEEPIGPIPLTGIDPAKIRFVSLLRDGAEAHDGSTALGARKKKDTRFVSLAASNNNTISLPDPSDTVLKIELAD
ncbi:MAG: alpha-L-fucosidase [Treponema sp.]|jgi:alpha-L-fucosidase|nr:alpha-L-fucosidase [Treponema sp.]